MSLSENSEFTAGSEDSENVKIGSYFRKSALDSSLLRYDLNSPTGS